jgi:hypothetical protein
MISIHRFFAKGLLAAPIVLYASRALRSFTSRQKTRAACHIPFGKRRDGIKF